jgi:hypothetical protein
VLKTKRIKGLADMLSDETDSEKLFFDLKHFKIEIIDIIGDRFAIYNLKNPVVKFEPVIDMVRVLELDIVFDDFSQLDVY